MPRHFRRIHLQLRDNYTCGLTAVAIPAKGAKREKEEEESSKKRKRVKTKKAAALMKENVNPEQLQEVMEVVLKEESKDGLVPSSEESQGPEDNSEYVVPEAICESEKVDDVLKTENELPEELEEHDTQELSDAEEKTKEADHAMKKIQDEGKTLFSALNFVVDEFVPEVHVLAEGKEKINKSSDNA